MPYLPLVAKQILLNNLLSDVPSIAISTDRVDPEHLAVPQRWNMKEVRRFMVVFGLVSTVFDLLTFALRTLFGFVSLPPPLVLALGVIVIGYLATTEAVKVAWRSGPWRGLTERKADPAPHSTVPSRWNSPPTIPPTALPPKRPGAV